MAKSKFRKAAGYSEALKKRTEQAASGFITIFKDNLNLPLYKEPKEGDVGIDIIPYLASANHFQAEEGEPVYKLEVWVHQRVGPEKGDYVCLRNFGEECPLCEARYREMAEESPRQDVVDGLKGSQRAIYNVVIVSDSKEEDKGVQIWTSSTYLGEQNFQKTAKNRKTGEKIPFSCPDTGRTIWFTVQGSKFSKEFAGITLEERPEPISDAILDDVFILEDCLVIPKESDLEKIAKIVLGSGASKERDEPDPPSRRGRRPSRNEDEGEGEDEPPTRRGRSLEDEGEDEPPKRSRRTETDEDEGEDDPPPTKRGRKKTEDEGEDEPPKKSRRTETDEGEGEDEPEKEAPKRRRRSTESDDDGDEAPPKRRSRIRRND